MKALLSQIWDMIVLRLLDLMLTDLHRPNPNSLSPRPPVDFLTGPLNRPIAVPILLSRVRVHLVQPIVLVLLKKVDLDKKSMAEAAQFRLKKKVRYR